MDDISINCPHENFNVNHDLTQNPPRFIILTILILSLSDTEHVSLFFIHMFYHIEINHTENLHIVDNWIGPATSYSSKTKDWLSASGRKKALFTAWWMLERFCWRERPNLGAR